VTYFSDVTFPKPIFESLFWLPCQATSKPISITRINLFMYVPSFVLRLSSSPYTIYPLLRLVNQNTSSCQLAHAETLDWNSALGYSGNNHKPTRGHTYFPLTYHSIQQLLEYMYISPMYEPIPFPTTC